MQNREQTEIKLDRKQSGLLGLGETGRSGTGMAKDEDSV